MKYILCTVILTAVASAATGTEYYKYTDQNGVISWQDKSKTPSLLPVQHKYEDNNGITFWVDDMSKVPDEYKNSITSNKERPEKSKTDPELILEDKKQYSTKISIVDNVIIIPVVFRNKGRKVKAKMILDTGASVTTIYSALASKLNLNRNKLSKVRSMNANGISSESLLTKVDHIEVEDKILANVEVIIIPSHSNIGADGLLGNSFLRFFNFTIDYDKQLLRWN